MASRTGLTEHSVGGGHAKCNLEYIYRPKSRCSTTPGFTSHPVPALTPGVPSYQRPRASPGGRPRFGVIFTIRCLYGTGRTAEHHPLSLNVVGESPGKVKSINKYLGADYKVLASFGHIRDLPSKDGSVKPDDDFSMTWEVDDRAQKRIKDIADAVKGADKLILATDPDREGEAISWHVLEVLKQRKALAGVKIERVAFNAVTKSAVQEAIQHPREINEELVDAYLARRALDYLVGFTLSPVLWRKLPGARSAGRAPRWA